MIYVEEITAPAGTSKDNPVTKDVEVTKGLVYKINIVIPSGHAGLTGLWITRGNFQVWPVVAGTFFKGDNEHIDFDDMYLVDEPPFVFKLHMFNNDDTYDHTMIVRLGLVSKEEYMMKFLPSMAYSNYMDELAKDMEAKKKQAAEQKQALLESPFPWLD